MVQSFLKPEVINGSVLPSEFIAISISGVKWYAFFRPGCTEGDLLCVLQKKGTYSTQIRKSFNMYIRKLTKAYE